MCIQCKHANRKSTTRNLLEDLYIVRPCSECPKIQKWVPLAFWNPEQCRLVSAMMRRWCESFSLFAIILSCYPARLARDQRSKVKAQYQIAHTRGGSSTSRSHNICPVLVDRGSKYVVPRCILTAQVQAAVSTAPGYGRAADRLLLHIRRTNGAKFECPTLLCRLTGGLAATMEN